MDTVPVDGKEQLLLDVWRTGVGEGVVSEVLKLLVLDRMGSNFFTDLTSASSLPKVEIILIPV